MHASLIFCLHVFSWLQIFLNILQNVNKHRFSVLFILSMFTKAHQQTMSNSGIMSNPAPCRKGGKNFPFLVNLKRIVQAGRKSQPHLHKLLHKCYKCQVRQYNQPKMDLICRVLILAIAKKTLFIMNHFYLHVEQKSLLAC